MTRRRKVWPLLVLALVAFAVTFVTFRQGLVPARFTPLPRLDLDNPLPLLVDWQIAELRLDRELCAATMRSPHIEARPISDNAEGNGCGWINAVAMSSVAGARVPTGQIACEAAAAFALWMTHEVQPTALAMFGERVTFVRQMGTYSCRNIIGSSRWRNVRSEHATANAIDVGAFRLASGRTISVLKDWSGTGPEARFLRAVHSRACRYFRVVLGPEFNAAHRDHFHFDRGILWRCV